MLANKQTEPIHAPSERPPDSGPRLSSALASTLKRMRTQRGLSLERFSTQSGVSRAMLGQLEHGKSVPSVAVLWKISRALDVSFTALLNTGQPRVHFTPGAQARYICSRSGRSSYRVLSTELESNRVTFYELQLDAAAVETVDALPEGTRENIAVRAGALTVTVSEKQYHLDAGDSLSFDADIPYTYENPGPTECCAYVVRSFPARF